jgi:hypothetical protein
MKKIEIYINDPFQKSQEKRSPKSIIKKFIIIISILLATCVCFIIIVNIVAMLPVELHDKDLIYQPKQIDDDKNAFVVLLPALKKMKEEKLGDQLEPFMEDGVIDFHKNEELFRKSLPHLETFDKAMKLDTMQFPADHYTVNESPSWRLQDIIYLGRLEHSRIKEIINDGDIVQASEEVEKFLKYGYLLQNVGGTLVDQAIAMVVQGMAISSIQELAKTKGMDSSLCGQLMKSIRKYGDNSGIVESLKGDYTFVKNVIKRTDKDRLNDKIEGFERYKRDIVISWVFNETATINNIANLHREQIKNIYGKYSQRKRSLRLTYLEFLGHAPTFVQMLFGNPTGKIMLNAIVKGYGVVESKFQKDAMVNLTITLLALRAYYNDNKTLPVQLNDLVPAHLSEIPEDPFDNKKLRYMPGQKIIYSVGFDMKDNQGDKKKDIIVDIAFP